MKAFRRDEPQFTSRLGETLDGARAKANAFLPEVDGALSGTRSSGSAMEGVFPCHPDRSLARQFYEDNWSLDDLVDADGGDIGKISAETRAALEELRTKCAAKNAGAPSSSKEVVALAFVGLNYREAALESAATAVKLNTKLDVAEVRLDASVATKAKLQETHNATTILLDHFEQEVVALRKASEVSTRCFQLLTAEASRLRVRSRALSAAITGARVESNNLHQTRSALPASVSKTIQRQFDVSKAKIVKALNEAFATLLWRSDEIPRSLQDRSRHSSPLTESVSALPPPL